jgi:uncharacterized protein YaaN involved in tellurite resistance
MDDMQNLLADLDPEKAGKLGILMRLLTRNPLAARAKKVARKYESAKDKIESIEKGLDKGSELLQRDSRELLGLHDSLQVQQVDLAKKILVLDEVSKGISSGKAVVPRTFTHQLSTNLADLKLMMIANDQFQRSIDIVVNNNTDLAQSVSRVRTLASNIARTGLSLQAALLQQKRTQKAVEGTKKFMGDMIKSNAEMLKTNAAEIAESANSPVLSLDKIKESHKILQETVAEMDRIRQKTAQESEEALRAIDAAADELKTLPSLSAK